MAKERAVVKEPKDEIGMNKFELISTAYNRVKNCKEEDYYLEAITILESLIGDRMEAILSDTEGEQIGFQTLERLIKIAKRSEVVEEEMKQMVINELTPWKDKRNQALHEMVKLQADDLHDWNSRYDSFKLAIDEGLEIFKQLNKYRKRIISSKKKQERD